ncbi:hypothetical protein KDX30_15760 [Pseudomonas sp. CDFA 553]|uniref:hypothetical protein n=1 Tax=Pseudomonas quasicaspiana TaxID=2829821 RepID=UPI001E323B68|nr:hypothetical protein [Pseudomonas quasicaspiana]MCD5989345.1 hypothetical protein [Pseudomonas quasicaspiana]
MNTWTNFFMISGNMKEPRWTFINVLLIIAVTSTTLLGLSGFFTMGTDLWDGVIAAHAVNIDRPDIYHEWFGEAGLFFTPLIYDVIYYGHGLIGYEKLAKFFTILFLGLASIEVSKIIKRYFQVPPSIANYAALLFFLSPAWVLYYSNIYLMHSFSLFLTLICTRHLLERRLVWLTLPVLLLSFQQSSDAPLAISLILLSSVYIHTSTKERIINAAAIVFIVIGFFLLRKLFPTHGLYANYNKIDPQNILNIKDYLRYLKYFITLYFPFFAIATALIIFSRNFIMGKSLAILIAGIMLNCVAYVAVGKIPYFSEIGSMHGESLRFTFTSTVFAALLIPIVWQASAFYPKVRTPIIVALMIYACTINIFAHQGKMKEVLFQRGMIAELMKIPDLPECVVNIHSEGVAVLTIYEYGDIFYKAYGKTAHLILGASLSPQDDSNKLYQDFPTERYRYKYFIPQQQPSCTVGLNVKTNLAKLPLPSTLYHYFSGDNSDIVDLNPFR